MKYAISVGGKKFEVEIEQIVDGQARISVNHTVYEVALDNYADVAAGIQPSFAPVKKPARSAVALLNPSQAAFVVGDDTLSAPIPGLILEVRVKVGEKVSAGQVVAIMEAMKMENNLIAHKEGIVREILAVKGTEVSTGDPILVIR
jgi:biotin carboxyl carrier protein